MLKTENFFLPSFSLIVLFEVSRERGTMGADVCGSIEGAKDDGVRRMSCDAEGAARGGRYPRLGRLAEAYAPLEGCCGSEVVRA